MPPRRVALAPLLLLVCLAGCASHAAAPDAPEACPAGGRPRAEGASCQTLVAGCCFAVAADACRAAGCDAPACVLTDTEPARPTCTR